ncbi:ABC transporter ATP-binding protein [Castellaniella sp.]|uniref:ABC transporter ATP-binding protein n=1 Tax=Castellaniella sp. TaxID=1955812 RepID=UPI002AFE0426|nr:ABC transporter ATP-binding protein [Castellaniella sp.]
MNESFQQLRLDGVGRQYPTASGSTVAALKDLSLDIRRGEFIALLGPSGCGKSTALNCLAGLADLSTGSIWLDDTRIDVLPPERRGFGMVFQNYALFPHMSVRDNVGFGLRMRGVPKQETAQRVKAALSLVQLEGHETKLPGQLSGGQQQRVAIARAIVIEPPVILMDEPLSNLDAKLRVEMRAEIRRIHRQLERATIYVTHDQDEALSMADRIVVMRAGSVQQVGSPREVYGQPRNLHVARFMGYRNVLAFQVIRHEGERITVQQGQVQLQGTALSVPAGTQTVAVAMRPDDFELATDRSTNTLDATIQQIEFGGRSSLLVVSSDIGELFVRISGDFQPGDRVRLHIPADRVLTYTEAP